MPELLTKVVKVPVRVMDEDEKVRIVKYRALDKVMGEARYLGNMAIRYGIAFPMKGIQKEFDHDGKEVNVETRTNRIVTAEKVYLEAGTVATLIRNCALKLLRTTDKDAWAGRKSLPTFKSLFVPFRHVGTRIVESGDQFLIEPAGFGYVWLPDDLVTELGPEMQIPKSDKKLRLVSTFSWKHKGAADVVRRIVKGEYKLCDSTIKRRGEDLMVFLSYKFAPKAQALDPMRVCGVDLGVSIPAVCAVNFGPQRLFIGKGVDVYAARSKFRSERIRSQSRLGLYSKTHKWNRSQKEERWIESYYHALSRAIIKFCLQYDCGTLHIEDLSKLRQEHSKNEFKRLMWSPQKLKELLTYKTKEAGIKLVLVNPANTSRRCHECGHIDIENRMTRDRFKCLMCGYEANADYVGAKNVALA